MAHHAPMTYVFRSYWLGEEPAKYVVYFCDKDGRRWAKEYADLGLAKAFMESLDGLGFTKKRR